MWDNWKQFTVGINEAVKEKCFSFGLPQENAKGTDTKSVDAVERPSHRCAAVNGVNTAFLLMTEPATENRALNANSLETGP